MIDIEFRDESIYLSTDNREEILELIQFLVKMYARLEQRGQYQVTVYELREGGEILK